jgi:hypothetical protein
LEHLAEDDDGDRQCQRDPEAIAEGRGIVTAVVAVSCLIAVSRVAGITVMVHRYSLPAPTTRLDQPTGHSFVDPY